MPVTSTTLAGVNVWRLSGAVTDAELKTAWSALVVFNRYKIGRSIYIDNTANLTGLRGSFYVDMEANSIILHTGRNKANTVFNNFEFVQTVGLSVANRNNFVRTTNGTTITTTSVDGIDMKGGAMIYAVTGNPGGADPRYLNEMIFGSLDGTLITSAAFTELEIEPTSYGRIWKGLTLQKVAGFPILSDASGTQRQVVYRSSLNTEGTQRIVRPYYNNSICYVSSFVRRNGIAVTASLMDTYGSTGTAVVMVLNSWLDESWFGASKTTLTAANWSANNRVIGGVLKKILVQPSTLINVYDSRSTTAPAKSTFSETTSDFLSGTTGTTSDASTGQASIVVVGAIATGSTVAITRYTGQKFTLQKFGYEVQVITPDMTFGDDDLSAFSPIVMNLQDGITRTQAIINAATLINSYTELVEELHVLAIGLVGAASYNAFKNGNLFEFTGSELITNFSVVNINKTATSKIAYNSTTNTLTIKSNVLTGGEILWKNSNGVISTSNGAILQGSIEDLNGDSSLTIEGGSGNFTLWKIPTATSEDSFATGVNLGNFGNVTVRFTSASGFKIVVRDNTTGYRQVQSMTKGIYTIGMFFGSQVQIAESAEITYIKNKIDTLENYNDTTIKTNLTQINEGLKLVSNFEPYEDNLT